MSVLNRFPTGGGSSDDLTATPGEVLSGYKFVGASTDDVQVGTLQLTGNAATNHVLSGTTFYTNNPKNKLTGYMAINNIRGFSVSLISGRNVTVQWTNPVQTAGYPYSGVYVKYQTGSYPTPSTGTQAYKGVGSSGASGAVSQINLTMPSLGTTYYFICYSYCITSNGELIGLPWQTTVNTGSSQIITINATQNYTIPAGYNSVDLFCVGGGGSGSWMNSKYTYGGGGGGGGYTKTVKNVAVSAGQVLYCVVGNGGSGTGASGAASTVFRNGVVLCSADGGKSDTSITYDGGSGGSGGGGGGQRDGNIPGQWGGSNGAGGGSVRVSGSGGRGQGFTTTAFRENWGTVYSGGGGGAGANTGSGGGGNAGGGGGGGAYGGGGWGSANTGGGGGGQYWPNGTNGGNGGSGVILIRIK